MESTCQAKNLLSRDLRPARIVPNECDDWNLPPKHQCERSTDHNKPSAGKTERHLHLMARECIKLGDRVSERAIAIDDPDLQRHDGVDHTHGIFGPYEPTNKAVQARHAVCRPPSRGDTAWLQAQTRRRRPACQRRQGQAKSVVREACRHHTQRKGTTGNERECQNTARRTGQCTLLCQQSRRHPRQERCVTLRKFRKTALSVTIQSTPMSRTHLSSPMNCSISWSNLIGLSMEPTSPSPLAADPKT